MKLPGDSDNMDKGVSHEMMQRSLQSQRRVVQRVNLLEDKVEALENVEIEEGVDLGELADGAKKIAGKIKDKAKEIAPKVGDKAKKVGSKVKDKVSKKLGDVGDAAKNKVRDVSAAAKKKLTDVGQGLKGFVGDKIATAKAIGKKPTVGKGAKTAPSQEKVAPKAQPQQDLVPDSVAAFSKRADGSTIYDKNERIREFLKGQGKPIPEKYQLKEAGEVEGTESLEDAGLGENDKKKNVDKKIEKDFEVDPKMKKAFSEALALPAKSAAVALIDLLEKIPAPSKEASKILNRNMTKITNAFKLGAASAEVANDEEDNDEDDEEFERPSLLGALVNKAMGFFGNKKEEGGGDSGSGDSAGQISGSSPQQKLLSPQMGDPTTGKRAPYTGTADGIGLGDGSGRAMQPIKKRKGLAKKLFGMTPMGMAFNAASAGVKGLKSLTQTKAFNNITNIGKKAFNMTPMGMGLNLGKKVFGGVKNIFAPKGEQTVNLTELTDKTIQENREAADSKTEKAIAVAEGTGGIGGLTDEPAQPAQEGSELARPNIIESPFINVYNTTSQF
tara:strand:+ start:7114 stop:8784 length:1671 start_codon:yes stop_codon:yes gene_type:complete